MMVYMPSNIPEICFIKEIKKGIKGFLFYIQEASESLETFFMLPFHYC